ncbi:ADP-ribose glycohydrolase OARD1-like [Metopolophium dirhodum]|uniref:ADP-ribose glycohydrolase OARD1-like n=1 Tax=Metopolophium dirhodum TaxID=44670 RepID=UPI00298F44E3|nr:ADP-ribose glycohydrolase OARD1-like [Metopolophium dirhodum]
MKNIAERTRDLFSVDVGISLAHRVLADFKSRKGIAFEFRNRFGKVNELRRQKCQITEIATINVKNHQVFYIITKEFFWQKTSYEIFFQSLQNLKSICVKYTPAMSKRQIANCRSSRNFMKILLVDIKV